MKLLLQTLCLFVSLSALAGSVSVVDGTVSYAGDFAESQELASAKGPCRVSLNGASFRGGFTVPDGLEVEIRSRAGTTNSFRAISAAKASLRFTGEGVVRLEGLGTLMTVSDLSLSSGKLEVKATGCSPAETSLVNVLGSYLQTGGELDLDLGLSGEKRLYGLTVVNREPCRFEVSGGTVRARVGGTKSAALRGEKGSVDFVFKGDALSVSAVLCGVESRFVDTAGKQVYKGGSYSVTMPDDYAACLKPRVFKAGKAIKVKAGSFKVNVPGEGAEVFSSDDSGVIDGGDFDLTADDDCISAVNNITVNGGTLTAVSLNDDVLDSNGDIVINGGQIRAFTTAKGHEAFDVDPMKTEEGNRPHRLTINGGVVFATGGKDSAWPSEIVKGKGVGVYAATDLPSPVYSEKTISFEGEDDARCSAKLPRFKGKKCAILVSFPGLKGEPKLQ